MWKFVFVLLVTAIAVLIAQLIADAPVIQTRVGATVPATPVPMYGGIRGGGGNFVIPAQAGIHFLVCASRAGFRLSPE